MRNRIATILLLLPAIAVAVFYIFSAVAHISIQLSSRPDGVGFGPDDPPLWLAIYVCIRAISGAVIVVSAYKVLTRHADWLGLLTVTLIVVNVSNGCVFLKELVSFKEAGVSVLDFFPMLMIVEFSAHLIALMLCVSLFSRSHSARRRKREEA